jgi:Pentapeptide repeats (8 copies)
LRQLVRLPVLDPRVGCAAAAAVRDAMGDESISTNGESGTKEAEALASALNHSAERVQTLWFSFLTFMLYLAVAIGTTTHRMLFLEEPLNLPVLNIPLPLVAFYILTPVIFIVFHFYMLLNLVLLARTAKSFEDALVRAFPEDSEARENFRMRIENTLFVQLLVGGRLALISLALAPVALLLMFEIMFLPYHSEKITWLHRGLLALDLALVWTLWPGYRSGWGVRLWPKTTWRLVAPCVLSAAALVYAGMVATFPDESIYLATKWLRESDVGANARTKITPINTLDLHGEDLIDDAKLAHILEKNESSTGAQRWVGTLSLSDRDLTGAYLWGADVRHVDFAGAILNRAYFDDAWAERASFGNAQLRGASLDAAQLQGATLNFAKLQGASLDGTQLQGAGLAAAHLQGASLDHAQLQGALLDGAHLQGASLDGAQLQGALLDRARLQGASLDRAELQGASLDKAELQGASFAYVCVWRADARQAAWKDTRVARPETGLKANRSYECDWTAASFAALKQLIAEKVPEGDNKRAAMERIERRLDPTKALEGEDEMAKVWAAARESVPPTPEAYEKSLAGQWRELGCAAEGAPYVLHALIARLSSADSSPFRDQSAAVKTLASDFLDEAHCPGAHGLSEADKATLKKIAATVAPPAPKP